jgi:FkbM family methyltransferase
MSPCNALDYAAEYFDEHYRWMPYTDLEETLLEQVRTLQIRVPPELSGGPENMIQNGAFWVRVENAAQDMVIVRDIYYEDAYRTNLIRERIERASFVVDVGAHIGCFAKRIHEMNPKCRIICVEACEENLPALRKNVGDFATIVHAVCTYEKGPLVLFNAYYPNCLSTGGSMVMAESTPDQLNYTREPVRNRTTLEQLMWPWCFDHIDLLKLDCEGSEFSILSNTTSLRKIGFIVGEYHGAARWEQLRMDRFPESEWDYGHMSQSGDLGNFHLKNRLIQ